jgi:hypothetical protein
LNALAHSRPDPHRRNRQNANLAIRLLLFHALADRRRFIVLAVAGSNIDPGAARSARMGLFRHISADVSQ